LSAICVLFAVATLGQAAPPDVVRVLQTEAVERG
jgi:hypothetical protein